MRDNKERMFRDLHTAYQHGTWELYNIPAQRATYFPTDKPIIGYFNFKTGESFTQEEFERRKNEFRLRGAL